MKAKLIYSLQLLYNNNVTFCHSDIEDIGYLLALVTLPYVLLWGTIVSLLVNFVY